MAVVRKKASVAGLGSRLKELRGSRGQMEFARLLGVDQSSLAKWETGARPIPIQAILRIAEEAPRDEERYWLRHAGVDLVAVDAKVRAYKKTLSYVDGDMLIVPIRSGAIAAGQPLSMEVEEYEGRIGIPLAKAADTGRFIAAWAKGESMAPRIMDGYLVVIDTRRRPPQENVGHIVAAADEEGNMTIKILAGSKGSYFLIAGNPNFVPYIQPIDVSNQWAIAGRVTGWLGNP